MAIRAKSDECKPAENTFLPTIAGGAESEIARRFDEYLRQGRGDRWCARKEGITRHQARKLLWEAERRATRGGELLLPDPPPGAPAAAWVPLITAAWQRTVGGVLEVGRLLIAAKTALPHGEFGKMIDAELPFGARAAQMLMAIASDPRITNHASYLPPSYTTLYRLTQLSDPEWERGIKEKKIRPDMERNDVDAIKGARALMASREEPDDSLDYFPTPPWATRALFEHVMPCVASLVAPTPVCHCGGRWQISRSNRAWDPACGAGHVAEVMREYVDDVIATDIHDYGYGRGGIDFLLSSADEHADWIITNPPFGEKTEQFVRRAIELADSVAMFVRLQWLETVGRYELFKEHPPTLLAFFAERVNLCRGRWDPDGTTATAYMWIVWLRGKLEEGVPRAMWIPPGQREALSSPDDRERFTRHPVAERCPPVVSDGVADLGAASAAAPPTGASSAQALMAGS